MASKPLPKCPLCKKPLNRSDNGWCCEGANCPYYRVSEELDSMLRAKLRARPQGRVVARGWWCQRHRLISPNMVCSYPDERHVRAEVRLLPEPKERKTVTAFRAHIKRMAKEADKWPARKKYALDGIRPLTVPSAATLRATKAVMYFKSARPSPKGKGGRK